MTLLSELKGRPMWAALNIHKQEISLVLKHIDKYYGSFQYCLTISLSDPKDIDVLKEQCNKLDLRLVLLKFNLLAKQLKSFFQKT